MPGDEKKDDKKLEKTDKKEFDGKVLDIAEQYIAAFAQGTGSLRISRSAVRHIRNQVQTKLTKESAVVGDWESKFASGVLEYMRAVGRLATHHVVTEGRTTVEEGDVKAAIKVVIGKARAQHTLMGVEFLGSACPQD